MRCVVCVASAGVIALAGCGSSATSDGVSGDARAKIRANCPAIAASANQGAIDVARALRLDAAGRGSSAARAYSEGAGEFRRGRRLYAGAPAAVSDAFLGESRALTRAASRARAGGGGGARGRILDGAREIAAALTDAKIRCPF